MKLKKSDPLYIMYKESRKISDDNVKLLNKSEDKYYFKVGEHEVILYFYKKGNLVPLVKEFNCSCKHGSLFGSKENIPCKHIMKLIIWLDRNLE